MERRTVRIYKAPNGQGEYRSKLKSFVTANEGMSVDDSAMRKTSEDVVEENAINTYIKYINTQLKDGMSIQGLYQDLIEKGLADEEAAELLKYFVANNLENSAVTKDEEEEANQQQTMQEGGVPEEVLGEYESAKGKSSDDGESIDLMKLLKEPAENYLSEIEKNSKLYFPNISDYVFDYKPIEFVDPTESSVYSDLEQRKKGGAAKKSFVKNVLKHFAEGGEEKPAEQGNKMDTMTSEVTDRKNSFIAKIKEINEEAKIKNLYDQMMETNDPDLMQTAQTLAGGNGGVGQDNEDSLSYQQSGGYLGEGQPELFMYGGADFPFELEKAEGGKEKRTTKVKYVPNPTLPSSKLRLFNPVWGERKIYSNRPYNALTREIYRDPVDDLTPVARTVHKRGIFGRPKKWTDYYSKDGKVMIPPGAKELITKKETQLKHGMSEEDWNDLSGKARRAIRRGERRGNRRKGYEDEKELTIQELIALQEEKRKKENDEAYKERKDAIEKDNKRKKDFGRIDDPERKKADWETINDRINSKKESEKPKKKTWVDSVREEANRIYSQQLANQMGYGVNMEKILNQPYDPNHPDMPALNLQEYILNKVLDSSDNVDDDSYNTLNDYIPADERNTVAPETYQFTPGKSKARIAEEERIQDEMEKEREAAEWEDMMMRRTRKRLGGLPKAQLGVHSPTSTLSSASDPTANTMDLMNVLKPQENPNTLLGASAPWMNTTNSTAPINTASSNYSNITMDPNQTKDQTITSEDFGNPELIAQDFESKRDFNGEAFNQKLNSGIDAFTGIARRMDTNRQMADYYANNSGVDSFMNPQRSKLKGKFVDYGQETGLIDPTRMGNEKNSIFAGTRAQSGGYMQDGGQQIEMFRPNETDQETLTRFAYGQKGLSVSHRDSVAHQVDKILKYEQLRGDEDSNPLTYYKDPKYKKQLMDDIYPKISSYAPNASAIEKGEMMDFMFNSGKDPRIFAYQEYLRKTDPQNKTNWKDKEGKWKDRKSVDEKTMNDLYSKTIAKLSENERRQYTNLGRDWYYKNTAPKGSRYGDWDLKTKGPHPAYENTWYGRIWNTNDYSEFDPNNKKFKPKKEYGGYMQNEYAEGGVFDMTEDELREFIANGGEVEYLES